MGITVKVMTTISLKVPKPLLQEVEAEARRRGVSKSCLIRESLENLLRRKRAKKRVTCLELVADLVGKFKGPPDLSTNPKYLAAAIHADYNRERKNNR
jgi:Arc/MetJ-type ribon-helix-helix transcriptional regulator